MDWVHGKANVVTRVTLTLTFGDFWCPPQAMLPCSSLGHALVHARDHACVFSPHLAGLCSSGERSQSCTRFVAYLWWIPSGEL